MLYCKRDDRYARAADSPLQGNKLRKLRPLLERDDLSGRTVRSFGGAYSNHLAALAAAGRTYGFGTHFYVRGEAVTNPTLAYVRSCGSQLTFIDRAAYRRRHEPEFLGRLAVDTTSVWVPEGGTTPAALVPVGEVFTETRQQLGGPPDVFCLSAGTGGTAAGVLRASNPSCAIEVYPALRGNWMQDALEVLLSPLPPNLRLVTDYHFGGYAKFPADWRLYTPPSAIAKRADIGEPGLPPLEPVYTAKLFAGVLDRLRKGVYPPGSTIVVLHTGGIY